MRASRHVGRSAAVLAAIGLVLGTLTFLNPSPSGADGSEAPGDLLRARAITAGVGFTCAILDDDTVKCWGDDSRGQLGDGGANTNLGAPPANPINLGNRRTATAIAAGDTHTCAILDTGKVKCWGGDDHGQLGDGGTNTDLGAPPATPINLGNRRTATAITAGGFHTCAILDTGRVKCWGADDRGQVGDGGTDTDLGAPPTTPVALGTGRTAIAIAAGYLTTCAVLDDGSVKCWGADEFGALGDGGTDADLGAPAAAPIDLGSGRTATALSMGEFHTCAVLDDGSVKCWGADSFGQLGDGGTNAPLNAPPAAPIDLGSGRTATAITAGGFHSCAVLDDATLKCWGADTDGQLGDGGTNADLGAPPTAALDLGAGRTASAVTGGSLHTCAALDTARLKCWGNDQSGGLGDGGTDAGVAAPPADPVVLGPNRRVAGVPGPPCAGEPSTIVLENGDLPTEGRDVIYGTTGPDTIDALGGDDLVCGRGGDDTIRGGDGQDVIYGGDGEDTLRADGGGGVLGGNDGNDVLVGGDGNDTLRGGLDDDTITGRGGNDLANGGPGTDTCSLTPGVDTATDCEA